MQLLVLRAMLGLAVVGFSLVTGWNQGTKDCEDGSPPAFFGAFDKIMYIVNNSAGIFKLFIFLVVWFFGQVIIIKKVWR